MIFVNYDLKVRDDVVTTGSNYVFSGISENFVADRYCFHEETFHGRTSLLIYIGNTVRPNVYYASETRMIYLIMFTVVKSSNKTASRKTAKLGRSFDFA